jgi:hypothetical protein
MQFSHFVRSKIAALLPLGGRSRSDGFSHPPSSNLWQPTEERRDRPLARLIEDILVAEFGIAQDEFDRVKRNPEFGIGTTACINQYLEAAARLRKFLAYGEIPGDVMKKVRHKCPQSQPQKVLGRVWRT